MAGPDFAAHLDIAIADGFNEGGKLIADVMKDRLIAYTRAGRTSDSITYAFRTQSKSMVNKDIVGSRSGSEDIISIPGSVMELHVGTAVPYAQYINDGMEPIGAGVGSAEPEADGSTFRKHLLAWGIETFGASPEGISTAYAVMQHIADHGTSPKPFMIETYYAAEEVIATAMRNAIKRTAEKAFAVPLRTVIEVKVK